MTNKRFYTLAEMIVALRREYVKAYEILDKMKQCIRVDSSICKGKNEPFSSIQSDMRLSFNSVLNPEFHGDSHAIVILDVNKKGLFTIARKVFKTITGFESCFNPDRESYFLETENNGEYFYTGYRKHYVEKIYILEDKKEEFLNLFQQLRELDICNVLEAYTISSIKVGNIYSNIDIRGIGIEYELCRDYYNIKYDAQNDLIRYKTKEFTIDYNHSFYNILETRIPSYSIPDDYLNIIKKSDVNLENIEFENYLGKNGTLSISHEDGKKLVLSKTIKR